MWDLNPRSPGHQTITLTSDLNRLLIVGLPTLEYYTYNVKTGSDGTDRLDEKMGIQAI